jgi:hypothetical protein
MAAKNLPPRSMNLRSWVDLITEGCDPPENREPARTLCLWRDGIFLAGRFVSDLSNSRLNSKSFVFYTYLTQLFGRQHLQLSSMQASG